MNTRPTPETIAESFYDSPPEYEVVSGDFARRLERERDEAREQRDRLAEALEQLMAYQPRSTVITTNERHVWSNAKDALQSLTQPTEP